MLLKRKIYLIAIVLTMFFAAVLIAFIAQKDNPEDYKGTLVKGYCSEAVI